MRIDKLVVLVSGGGTNLQAVIDACRNKRIPAKIVGVISSKPGVYALERAKKAEIPSVIINNANGRERDNEILDAVKSFGGQAIILAGYMSILGKAVVDKYKTVNVHPALIPSFCGKGYYGKRVHEAVINYGVKRSGATVHFVDEGTDTGPIIMQKCVEVKDDDTAETLAARVLKAEHEILVKSVACLCEGRLMVCERRVKIINEK